MIPEPNYAVFDDASRKPWLDLARVVCGAEDKEMAFRAMRERPLDLRPLEWHTGLRLQDFEEYYLDRLEEKRRRARPKPRVVGSKVKPKPVVAKWQDADEKAIEAEREWRYEQAEKARQEAERERLRQAQQPCNRVQSIPGVRGWTGGSPDISGVRMRIKEVCDTHKIATERVVVEMPPGMFLHFVKQTSGSESRGKNTDIAQLVLLGESEERFTLDGAWVRPNRSLKAAVRFLPDHPRGESMTKFMVEQELPRRSLLTTMIW